MIFLDTSAIYALADVRDANHPVAVARFGDILEADEPLLTHNYVVLESMSLLQARLGPRSATTFARESSAFTVEWVDRDLHAAGVRELERSGKRGVSFVDRVSFLVMKRRKVTTAFAFDPDFETEGFRLFEA
jgi:predicted nucleic acid-binding protein